MIKQWAGTHDLKKVNGEWWKGACKVITGTGQDKRKIIQAYHDVPAYGHPGINRTKELVAKYYWWPQLAKEVQEYVKGASKPNHTSNRSVTVPDYIYGLYCEVTGIGRIRLHPHHHRSRLYKDANHDTLQGDDNGRRSGRAILTANIPQIRTTIKDHQR